MQPPNQAKPAVRDAHRRPWRTMNRNLFGILPQQEEGDYEVNDSDGSGETTDSEGPGE